VTVAPVIAKRRYVSTRELAARWRMPEPKVRLLLAELVATGYVLRRGDCWRASAKARRLGL
jgi:DNA-binding IclR family transcriptional regulator